jgi:hypothetical protein
MRKRKFIAGIAAVCALGGFLGTTWTGASGESVEDDSSRSSVSAAGETILLVVADVVAHAAAATRLTEINAPFGELQGFYADATDGYEVLGALLQTSADVRVEPCAGVLDPLTATSQLIDPSCPLGEVARTLQPIETALVSVDALRSGEARALCVFSGASCGIDRVKDLLGDDLALTGGLSLLTTGFRTKRGAQEFLELARAAGIVDLVTLQVQKLADGDVGLGQEPAPDGSGPLIGPLEDQQSYQR